MYQVGITEKDAEKDNINKLIKSNLISNVSKRQISVITAMLEQVIVPNLVVNDTWCSGTTWSNNLTWPSA